MGDLLCFSHLRWDFVFQRPQHLLTRAARGRRVLFVEEPVFDGARALEVRSRDGVMVVTPHLRDGADAVADQRGLLDGLLADHVVVDPVIWYYTPAALPFTEHLRASVTVYDCMDELSAFHGAPAELRHLEARLLSRADLVFAGGRSLYAAKRQLHPRVHLFPSSVDAAHFRVARSHPGDPTDQERIPRPRAGFFGVIDERLDRDLVAAVADAHPDLQLVLVGPITKIDRAALPLRTNIHYLGGKPYAALPAYIAGWDIAWMPFARSEATRFISPTKVLEYMAAGSPIVATSIQDVVHPYGKRGLVRIADTAGDTLAAFSAGLAEDPAARHGAFDALLATTSWDSTWARMSVLIDAAAEPAVAPALQRAASAAARALDPAAIAGPRKGQAA